MHATPRDLDHEALREVLERHPVSFAVLFGSHARGQQSVESDIDLAVAFEDAVEPDERLSARVDLIVDLSDRLETDAVDVADMEAIDPAVGNEALRTGTLLIGRAAQRRRYLERFQTETEPREDTHEQRIDRLKDIVARLEAKL